MRSATIFLPQKWAEEMYALLEQYLPHYPLHASIAHNRSTSAARLEYTDTFKATA